jgi:hypothetical protein
LSRPDILAELADRFEERQALDVADRAADLDQHDVGVVRPRRIASLISLVMCGITCTVRRGSRRGRSFLDDAQIDLPVVQFECWS